MRGRFSLYIGLGPGDSRRGPWISEKNPKPSFYFDFFILGIGFFQLFLVYLEKWLYKIHLDFGIIVVYHHSHLQCNQEGHNFITSGFIGPQILNFDRSLSLSLGPQSSLVPPCKISLGGPAHTCWCPAKCYLHAWYYLINLIFSST